MTLGPVELEKSMLFQGVESFDNFSALIMSYQNYRIEMKNMFGRCRVR